MIKIQVLQFLEDTNTGLLEILEEPPNNEPRVFFIARANITYKVIEEETGEREVKWELIPRDEMHPRLQIERGRTLLALLFRQGRKHQIAIDLDRWFYFDGIKWTQIVSACLAMES